jgi:hypothetical protein
VTDGRAGRSWQVTRAVVRIPALALALIVATLGAAELLARTDAVTARLLAPSLGSPSRPFEVQLHRLEVWVRRHGAPDCVFVGSSLALTGFDPEIVARAFADAGGGTIRCFNLGIPGLTAADATLLARVVMADHQPWLVLYGATALDFGATLKGPDLASLPWLQYRAGDLTLAGWLADVSRAYRYYLTYRSWLDPEERRLMARPFPSRADGFYGIPPSGRAVPRPPFRLTNRLVGLEIGARHLAALARLLDQRTRGHEVLVVEMPGPVAYSSALVATETYRRFLARIRHEIEEHHAPFWETWSMVPGILVPDEGFHDVFHMNTDGAAVLSRWLGRALANAVRRGELAPPTRAGADA